MASIWDDIEGNVKFGVSHIATESIIIAMAGIMVRMSKSDGSFQKGEYESIKHILAEKFKFDEDIIAGLILQANHSLKDTETYHSFKDDNDVEQFVSVLNKELDAEGKRKFAKMLWYIVLADKVIDQREMSFFDTLLPQLGILVSEIDIIKKEASGETMHFEDPITEMLKHELPKASWEDFESG